MPSNTTANLVILALALLASMGSGAEQQQIPCSPDLLRPGNLVIELPSFSTTLFQCRGVRATIQVKVGNDSQTIFDRWHQPFGDLLISSAVDGFPLHNVTIIANSTEVTSTARLGHALTFSHHPNVLISRMSLIIENSTLVSTGSSGCIYSNVEMRDVSIAVMASTLSARTHAASFHGETVLLDGATISVQHSHVAAIGAGSQCLAVGVGSGSVVANNMHVEVFNSSIEADGKHTLSRAAAVGFVSWSGRIDATNVTMTVVESTCTSTAMSQSAAAIGIAIAFQHPGDVAVTTRNVSIVAIRSNATVRTGFSSVAIVGVANFGGRVMYLTDTLFAAVGCTFVATSKYSVAVIGSSNHGSLPGNGHDSSGSFTNVALVSRGNDLHAVGCRYISVATVSSAQASVSNVSISVAATRALAEQQDATCGTRFDAATIAAFSHAASTDNYQDVSLCVRDCDFKCLATPMVCAAVSFHAAAAVLALGNSSVFNTRVNASRVGWAATGIAPPNTTLIVLHDVTVVETATHQTLPTDALFLGAQNLTDAEAADGPRCDGDYDFAFHFRGLLSHGSSGGAAPPPQPLTPSSSASTTKSLSHVGTGTVLPSATQLRGFTASRQLTGTLTLVHEAPFPTAARGSASQTREVVVMSSPTASMSHTFEEAPPPPSHHAHTTVTLTLSGETVRDRSSTSKPSDLPKRSILSPTVVQRTSEVSRAIVVAAALAPLGVPPSAAATPARMAAVAAIARCGEVAEPALMEVPMPAVGGAVGWHAIAQRVTLAGLVLALLVVVGCAVLGNSGVGKLGAAFGLGVTFGPYAFLSPALVNKAATVVSAVIYAPTADGLVGVDDAGRQLPPGALVFGASIVAASLIGWCGALAWMARGDGGDDDGKDNGSLLQRIAGRLRAEMVGSVHPRIRSRLWLRNFVVVDLAAALLVGALSGMRGSHTFCVVRGVLATGVSAAFTGGLAVYRPLASRLENWFGIIVAALQAAAAGASTVSLVQRSAAPEGGAAAAGLAELLATLGLAAACVECVVLAVDTVFTNGSEDSSAHHQSSSATGVVDGGVGAGGTPLLTVPPATASPTGAEKSSAPIRNHNPLAAAAL